MKKMIIYLFVIPTALLILLEIYVRVFANYCEPYFDKKTKIVKRKKNSEGIYRTEFTNTGYFRINNEGWNSHRDYFKRPSNVAEDSNDEVHKKGIRIAIIGHSNIEGLRVPINKTLSKIVEDDLLQKGINTEVYTFGFGGMHLAQALHVSRYVVDNFQPDILIIGTLMDDFLTDNTSKHNFLSLNTDSNSRVHESLPKKYREENDSPLSFLYFSKALKYTDIKTGLGKKMHNYFGSNSAKEEVKPKYDEDIKDTIQENMKILVTHYILQEFKKIALQTSNSDPQIYFIKFPLILPSGSDNNEVYQSDMAIYHQRLIDIIKNNDFSIIDLEQGFFEDYKENKQRFDFPNDGHYNQHAHEVIGRVLSNYCLSSILNSE